MDETYLLKKSHIDDHEIFLKNFHNKFKSIERGPQNILKIHWFRGQKKLKKIHPKRNIFKKN